MKSLIIRPKKQSALSQKPVDVNSINHDIDQIKMGENQGGEGKANFK